MGRGLCQEAREAVMAGRPEDSESSSSDDVGNSGEGTVNWSARALLAAVTLPEKTLGPRGQALEPQGH